jgi:hypothetical protein
MFARLVHVLMLFLLPLCAGALWSVASQILHRDLPWAALAMPVALLLMRGQLGFLSTAMRVILNGLAALMGIAYAQALITGVRVAAQFGYGPVETLETMGAAMTWELVWLRSGPVDWLAAALAVAISTWIGAGHRRRSPHLTPRTAP